MIIRGYQVKWEAAGFSFAVPIVSIRRTGFWRLFSPWKKVWEGDSRPYLIAEKMHPEQIKQWFTSAVYQYEAFKSAWEKENLS